jgi:hypothetical protein
LKILNFYTLIIKRETNIKYLYLNDLMIKIFFEFYRWQSIIFVTELVDSPLNEKWNINIFLFAAENVICKFKILILFKYNKVYLIQLITKKR